MTTKNELLDDVSKPKTAPFICTIAGEAGRGKTSMAATFPNPVFICSEDGLSSVPYDKRPDAFPAVTTVDDLWDCFKKVLNKQHPYKTLVIDSVTTLERLFIRFIMDSDARKPKSIRQAIGGFGAGYDAVASMHQQVRRAAGRVNAEKGMHVVFIAHADTEICELPDMDPYTRYTLRMNRKSMAPYIDEVSLVGLLKLKTHIRKASEDSLRGKAISDGSLVFDCVTSSNSVTKNRLGITEELPFKYGINPLKPYLDRLGHDNPIAATIKK